MQKSSRDDKKLYSYQDFATNTPADLKRFVVQRREYLRNHSELNKPTPKIISVEIGSGASPVANQPVSVKATLNKSVATDSVFLYYTTDRYTIFNQVMMTEKMDSFVGDIPAFQQAPLSTITLKRMQWRHTARPPFHQHVRSRARHNTESAYPL